MQGMNAKTGKTLDGLGHLVQSITDILTTRIGTRVMRRTYGSLVPDVIDYPANPGSMIKLYAAILDAIMKWEPRIRPVRIQAAGGDAEQGNFIFQISAVAATQIASIPAGTVVDLQVTV